MKTTLSKEDIREKYDRIAPGFRRLGRIPDKLLTGPLRRDLLSDLRGRVLDVACGTGENFAYFPNDIELTAVDWSPGMLAEARSRAERLGLAPDLRLMDAEALDFPDAHFDSVVSTLSTCTFPEPLKALREMARVCKPEGRILLLEHGRSRLSWLAHLQDRSAARHYRATGCRWNQKPAELVRQAGLEVLKHNRRFLGILYALEVRPVWQASEQRRVGA